jgi:hypothetical protein
VLRRVVTVAAAVLLLVPTAASAGTFGVQGSTLVYTGEDGVDQIAGIDTGTSYRFTRFGGVSLGGGPGCNVSFDQQSVDCPKGGITAVVLDLGAGDDVASVHPTVTVPVLFSGGDGDDGLFGGSGPDTFDAGAGNDNVVSRDERPEQVDCGSGLDTAISDDGDTRVSCEEIEGDADGDGVRRPADCDDTDPGIRPGAAEVPDDRIDQDCSGADATNLDADGDGFPRPQDCDDANAAIRPGAGEVIGNLVDENCDTRAVPFTGIGGVVRNVWAPSGSRTVNETLSAREFPRGTRIVMRCSGGGCPFRTVRRRVDTGRPINLHRFLGDAGLRRGARVTLEFTRAGRIGRVLKFRMRATPGVPSVSLQCRPPGQRVRDC